MRSTKVLLVFLAVVVFAATAAAQQSKRDEGIDLYRAGNFADAASRLAEATVADKMDRQAWLYLAAAYKHLGDNKSAVKAVENSMIVQKTGLPVYDKNAKITSRPRPDLSRGNFRSLTSNSLYTVAVELRSDGTIGVIIPYTISFADREPNVIAAVQKIKFTPAIKNGKPVTTVQTVSYMFVK